MKCGFYIIIRNDQLSGWTEKKYQSTFQSQTCNKKCSWSLFVGLLPIRSTTTFWNLVKPLITSEKCAQSISEMHQKLQHLQPALIKRKGPVLLHDNVWPTTHCTANASIVNKLLWCFASSSILTWPLANQLPLLQASRNFLQGKCFHNQQEAEHTFRKFIESWSTDFYATGINECISHWQNVLIVIVPILINQDIFKLSYKPLQYSYLENPVGREAWQAIVHRFTQSQMWLKRLVIMI